MDTSASQQQSSANTSRTLRPVHDGLQRQRNAEKRSNISINMHITPPRRKGKANVSRKRFGPHKTHHRKQQPGNRPANTGISDSQRAWRENAPAIKAAQKRRKEQQCDLLTASLRHILDDQSIAIRDKILLLMRANEESVCRIFEHTRSAFPSTRIPYKSGILPAFRDAAIRFTSWMNTTTALYIFDERQSFPYNCARHIENWLWRQAFKPYESDITLHHFSSIFSVEYNEDAHRDFSPDKFVAFHFNACEQAERVRDTAFPEEDNEPTPAVCGPLRSEPWPLEDIRFRKMPFDMRQAHLVQPLFRALFMAIFHPQDNLMDLRTPEEIPGIPELKVHLILTGATEGLSAPISFEELRHDALDDTYYPGAKVITTTLGAAVPFILRLREREIAASGGILQPDVSKVRGWNRHRERALKHGWEEERDGNLDELTARSCEWVNRDLFTKWVGEGAIQTLDYAMQSYSQLNPLREVVAEENWWWDRNMLPETPEDH